MDNTWFDITISRGPISGTLRSTVGLIVRVKADPAVEEFMKLHSKEDAVEAAAFGTSWVPIAQDQQLMVYNMTKFPVNQFSFGRYTIDSIARPLMVNGGGARGLDDPNGGGLNTINLSFFKLVGISKPEGVQFGVVGAYSLDYIANLNRQLLAEAKQFLLDYITPIDITLRLSKKV